MNTRINLPVIFAAAVLGASSCAVSSYVARDAQTLQISCASVRQMPVVAELAVSDIRATADTCYKSYFWNTREAAMKRNVASSLLAASNADVLVHPMTDVEKENLKFPYVSTKVKVSGYPAHYKNFRSATAEDFEVLDKADGKDVEEQSEGGIVINIGSYYAPADRVLNQGQTSVLGLVGSKVSKTTKQEISSASKAKSKYRKTGFSWGCLVLTNDSCVNGLFETGIGGAFGCFELFLRYHLSFGEKYLQTEHYPYRYEGGFHLGQGFKF